MAHQLQGQGVLTPEYSRKKSESILSLIRWNYSRARSAPFDYRRLARPFFPRSRARTREREKQGEEKSKSRSITARKIGRRNESAEIGYFLDNLLTEVATSQRRAGETRLDFVSSMRKRKFSRPSGFPEDGFPSSLLFLSLSRRSVFHRLTSSSSIAFTLQKLRASPPSQRRPIEAPHGSADAFCTKE